MMTQTLSIARTTLLVISVALSGNYSGDAFSPLSIPSRGGFPPMIPSFDPSVSKKCDHRRGRVVQEHPTHNCLFSTTGDDDNEEEQDIIDIKISDADINRVASSLEKLLGDDDDLAYSAERNRIRNLEREIQLLSQLDPDHPINKIDSKDEDEIQQALMSTQEAVLEKLWALWYGERGPLNERKLRLYEERLMDVRGSSAWPEVLDHYLDLIYEHCNIDGGNAGQNERTVSEVDFDKLDLGNWVEPANRLATLLFLMGRLTESKAWCERILEEKPWHVGALSGIVVVCLKLNDENSAMKWAMKALPGLSPQTRRLRSEWVKMNVKEAKTKLAERQEDLRKKIIAKAEVGVKTTRAAMTDNIGFDDSAWQ